MANPPIALDTIQVKVQCYDPGYSQLGESVLHYKVNGTTGTPLSLAAIAYFFALRLQAAYRAWLPSVATYEGVSVRNLTAPPTGSYTYYALGGAGTGGSTLLPGQVSGLIRWRTDTPGNTGRGRTYVPFPSAAYATTTGGVSVAGTGALNAIGLLLTGTIPITYSGAGGTTTVTHVIVPPTALTSWKVVVSGRALGTFATQRRRGGFGKKNPDPSS